MSAPKTTRGHVVVTGGAKRIGAAIIRHLAQDGWRVTIHYSHSRNEAASLAAELAKKGHEAGILEQDLLDTERLDALIPTAAEARGPVTCLINNASLYLRDEAADADYAQYEKHQIVHVYAPLVLSRSFAAQLPDGEEGCIINFGDGCEGWSMSPSFLTYSLSKYGVEHLTRLLAKGLGPRIRVNAILPGATLPGDQDKPGAFERLSAASLLERGSSVYDITKAVQFLIENRSMTGQSLAVNAGLGL